MLSFLSSKGEGVPPLGKKKKKVFCKFYLTGNTITLICEEKMDEF